MMKTKQDQSETSSLKQKSDIEEEYKVPNITPKELWSKSPQEFNDWRVKYDYPRILARSQRPRWECILNKQPK